jgi:hypothetical protein
MKIDKKIAREYHDKVFKKYWIDLSFIVWKYKDLILNKPTNWRIILEEKITTDEDLRAFNELDLDWETINEVADEVLNEEIDKILEENNKKK